jgi:hypothetical protein
MVERIGNENRREIAGKAKKKVRGGKKENHGEW